MFSSAHNRCTFGSELQKKKYMKFEIRSPAMYESNVLNLELFQKQFSSVLRNCSFDSKRKTVFYAL